MSTSDSVAKYSSMGTTVILYANRMEIQLPGGFFGKKEMIIYRNITSIEKPPLLNCIDINTSDGKKHRVSLMPPSQTDKLKQHIESLL
jgi:hypothetical protein